MVPGKCMRHEGDPWSLCFGMGETREEAKCCNALAFGLAVEGVLQGLCDGGTPADLVRWLSLPL